MNLQTKFRVIRTPTPQQIVKFGRKYSLESGVKDQVGSLASRTRIRIFQKRADSSDSLPAIIDRPKSADNRSLKIRGYLSTWQVDRDGERFVPGAYAKSIPQFMDENPIMLFQHNRDVIIGRWTKMREDQTGLYVEGVISGAPGLADIRTLIEEGILKTLSVGGNFFFGPNGSDIVQCDLLEGSAVSIPCNRAALFSVM